MSDNEGSKVFEPDDSAEVKQLREEISALRVEIADLKSTVDDLQGRSDALTGDENVSAGNGYIEVDRSVPKHPVVRFRADRLLREDDKPLEYFRVEKQDSEEDVPPIVELDARDETTPKLNLRGSGENEKIEIIGGSNPTIQVFASDVSAAIDASSGDYGEVYLHGPEGDECGLSANGGDYSINLATSDATQGDVSIQECDFYENGSETPTKINVVASAPFEVGRNAALPNIDAITGILFAINTVSGVKKLQATLTKTNIKTSTTSTATVDVCVIHDLDVVTDTDYTNPSFTQQKESVTVIGEAPSSSTPAETVFTTTPLSSELVS